MIEDIITLRASFLIDRVLTGMRMDFDRALEILRNHNDFTTERERQERDILVAAIDNLVDFAAAEECAMLDELPDELDGDDFDLYGDTCEKYNLTYAERENDAVAHAASMACWWIGVSGESVVTYMTQGDERVRDWHLDHEGESYPKSEFPQELIPPIEWGCRCFLVSDGFASVYGSIRKSDIKSRVNPVFAESLATGGRIFSPAHPYFQKPVPKEAERIAGRIKHKFYQP